MNDPHDPAGGNPRFLASVNIYGAGIAGLSAAHELMERGFKVRIVEPDRAMGPDGSEGPAIGGLARNQYLRAPKLLSPRWWEMDDDTVWSETVGEDGALPIYFERQSAALSEEAETRLRHAADAIQRKFGTVSLQVSSHAGDGEDDEDNRRLEVERTQAVKGSLIGLFPGLEDRHFDLRAGGQAARALTEPDRGVVTVQVVKAILPGEHGFHFFLATTATSSTPCGAHRFSTRRVRRPGARSTTISP